MRGRFLSIACGHPLGSTACRICAVQYLEAPERGPFISVKLASWQGARALPAKGDPSRVSLQLGRDADTHGASTSVGEVPGGTGPSHLLQALSTGSARPVFPEYLLIAPACHPTSMATECDRQLNVERMAWFLLWPLISLRSSRRC